MVNRVIIGMLAFLIILSGGLGGYSYVLNQEIKTLSQQLNDNQREQITQMSDLRYEMTAFSEETLDGIGAIRGEIGNLGEEIEGMGDDVEALSDIVNGTTGRINSLEDEVKTVTAEISESVIDTNKVYQEVRAATVIITDGDRNIGSGFVLDTSGHILTAHHVIDQLTTIYVVLSDGRSSKATIVGSCPTSDVAVLTLNDKQLVVKAAVLADSATVQVGQPVAVIGNPFDLTETLTSGIVSQIDRFAGIEYDSQTRWVPNLIQFDAAVNYGNSGGPLVNSQGEVIGLVIARVDPEKGDGIYYAVSANKARRVAALIIDEGSYDYPWIGVEIANITPVIAQDRNLETVHGVMIRSIFKNSPAEASGLKVGDIIIAEDDIPVRDIGQLTSYLGEHKIPGDQVSLTIIRDSIKLVISLTVGKRPS